MLLCNKNSLHGASCMQSCYIQVFKNQPIIILLFIMIQLLAHAGFLNFKY